MSDKRKLIYNKVLGHFEWEGVRCKPALEADVSSGSYDVPWLEFSDLEPDELCKRYNHHAELVEMVQALAYEYYLATGGDQHEPAHKLLAKLDADQ